MVTKYKAQRYDVIEALDEVDRFMTKMDNFIQKHPTYKYEIRIVKTVDMQQNHLWTIYLTIEENE